MMFLPLKHYQEAEGRAAAHRSG